MKPTWWPNRTGPARPSPPPLLPPPLSSSSCQWEQLRARTRAAEEATSSLPGCLLLPWSLPRRHAAPTPSHFSLALWTSLPPRSSALSLSRSTTSTREHRRAPPRPKSTTRLADASRRTAVPSSSSPPTHVTPGAPQRRPCRLHRRICPAIAAVDSPPPTPPRDHRAAHRPRCEPPCRTPLFPLAFASSRP